MYRFAVVLSRKPRVERPGWRGLRARVALMGCFGYYECTMAKYRLEAGTKEAETLDLAEIVCGKGMFYGTR